MPKSDQADISFSETMNGYIYFFKKSARGYSFERAASIAEQLNDKFEFNIKISIENLESFIADPQHSTEVSGVINCSYFKGECSLLPESKFQIFTKDDDDSDDQTKYMRYFLYFNYNGNKYTFFGEKIISKDDGVDYWNATTRLYCTIFCEQTGTSQIKNVVAKGILNLSPGNLFSEIQTFRAKGKNLQQKGTNLIQFMKFFGTQLWEQKKFNIIPKQKNKKHYPIYPYYTDSGVTECKKNSYLIETDDGLGLHLQRFSKNSTGDVVLLLHGLTTSSDMFIMPEHENIVSYLHKNGFGDVWSLDWRGSMRYPYNLIPNNYTIDDVALFDIPKALEKIRLECEEDVKIHVICHCVGSISFFMTLCSGLAGDIASVTSNSVSLVQKVGKWSQFKLDYAPWIVSNLTPFNYLLPSWSRLPIPWYNPQKLLAKAVSLAHPECNQAACHMLSFMWGTGRPACYLHENLDKETHARVGDLFGGVGVNYYKHISQMVKNGSSISYSQNLGKPEYKALSSNYLKDAKQIKVPILLITGSDNRVFENSNTLAYEMLKSKGVSCELRVIPNYGHQDTFMGKNSAHDVFPYILNFLKGQPVSSKVRLIENRQQQG